MLVTLMDVPARGIGLPDLHELVGEGSSPGIQQATLHGDALALGFAHVLKGEVGLDGGDVTLTERG